MSDMEISCESMQQQLNSGGQVSGPQNGKHGNGWPIECQKVYNKVFYKNV